MKYKVYDKQNKIIYSTFVSVCPDGSIIYLNEEGTWEEDKKDRFIALLYSDVKDMNGDDIYEGMKVKCGDVWVGDNLEKGCVCNVEFEDGCFFIVSPENPIVDRELDEQCVSNSGINIVGWSVDVDHEI